MLDVRATRRTQGTTSKRIRSTSNPEEAAREAGTTSMDAEDAEHEEAEGGDDRVLPTDEDTDTGSPAVTSADVHVEYRKLICSTCFGTGLVGMGYHTCDECQGVGIHPRIAHPAAQEIARLRNRVKELESATTQDE